MGQERGGLGLHTVERGTEGGGGLLSSFLDQKMEGWSRCEYQIFVKGVMEVPKAVLSINWGHGSVKNGSSNCGIAPICDTI